MISVNAGVLQGFILVPTPFLLYIDGLPYIAICADDTTVCLMRLCFERYFSHHVASLKDVNVSSFFPRTGRPWNHLPTDAFL